MSQDHGNRLTNIFDFLIQYIETKRNLEDVELTIDKDNFYKIYIDFLENLLNLAKNISNNETKVKNNLYK